jgi:hypothetical protein
VTEREKLEAYEKKKRIYQERGYSCEVCDKLISLAESQLAHRIAKSKPNLKKYGPEIIHHPKNLVLTCSDNFGRCNDSVNIGQNPEEIKKLLKEIKNEDNNTPA